MERVYIDYTFLLANGNTKIVSVKDVKENVTDNEVLAIAQMFIDKNSQFKGSNFTFLKKCEKYTINVEEIS